MNFGVLISARFAVTVFGFCFFFFCHLGATETSCELSANISSAYTFFKFLLLVVLVSNQLPAACKVDCVGAVRGNRNSEAVGRSAEQ